VKRLDDRRRLSAIACLIFGALAIATGIGRSEWWRVMIGFGLIVFGFILAYVLRREDDYE
jgi:positive regulator of sigma E activity